MRRLNTTRELVLLLFVLAGLLGSTGCSGSKNSSSERRNISVTIRTGPEAEALKAVAKEFEKRENISVTINELGRDVYMTAMPTQLMAGSSAVDAFFVPSTMIGEFAASKRISPLDEFIRRDPDFLVSYEFDGHLYALPTDVSTLFMFYRRDLIPKPPDTWDEYASMAERYTKSLNPQSATKYGAGFSGKGPEEPPKVFYPILWSFGGFIVENGRVGLDTPEAISAAKFYQSLAKRQVISSEVTSWSYPEVVEALERGDIAMAAPMWNAAFADIRSSKGPFRDKIDVAPLPGYRLADGSVRRVSFQHGWTLVLNSASSHKADAARFIEFATGSEGGRIYALAGGTPARRRLLTDDALRKVRPEFPLVLEMLSMSKAEPAVPYYNKLHALMNSALSALLLQQKTPEEIMTTAASQTRKEVQNAIQ